MSKTLISVLFPTLLILILIGLISKMSLTVSVGRGIQVGMGIGLIQSLISVAAIRWAWNKSCFYWFWGGGLIFRLLVFSTTAVIVYRKTTLNFMATLLSLVAATMFFLILEASSFKQKQNK